MTSSPLFSPLRWRPCRELPLRAKSRTLYPRSAGTRPRRWKRTLVAPLDLLTSLPWKRVGYPRQVRQPIVVDHLSKNLGKCICGRRHRWRKEPIKTIPILYDSHRCIKGKSQKVSEGSKHEILWYTACEAVRISCLS